MGNGLSLDVAARVDPRPLKTDDVGETTPLIDPAHRSGRWPHVWKSWSWEIGLILTLAGLFPLLVAAHFQSLGKPTFDDWSYLNSLATLARHGTFNFNHWASVFEVGQLLLVAPLYVVFGVHPVLAELWVWFVGLIGLFGLASLGRRCGVPRGVGLMILATLGVSPLFFRLDTTFMTDIPCFTCIVLALCLWTGCTNQSRFEARRWIALAVVTLAFSIREEAALVALPILYEPIFSAHRRGDRPARGRYLALAAVWVALLGALWMWRQGNLTSTANSPLTLAMRPFLQLWITGWLPAMLGLFMLPVLMVISPWHLISSTRRERPRLTVALVAVLFVAPLLGLFSLASSSPLLVQLGNVISIDPDMPIALRVLLSVIGLASFMALTLTLIGCYDARRRFTPQDRRRLGGLSVVAVAYSAALLAGTLGGLLMSDRYWFVTIALSALVLGRAGSVLRPPADSNKSSWSVRWGSVIALIVLVFYGAAVTVDDGAYLYGMANFAPAAASALPPGFGLQDINDYWVWYASSYTSDPAITPVLTATPHEYRYAASDGSGSYFYIGTTGSVGICAPFRVEYTTDVNAKIPQAIAIGPVSHGLFASYRFYLVRHTINGKGGCN